MSSSIVTDCGPSTINSLTGKNIDAINYLDLCCLNDAVWSLSVWYFKLGGLLSKLVFLKQ